MIYDQAEFEVRCEWGAQGVAQLAPISDVVVIVDVLSFSTSVEIATARGARVYPFRAQDETARVFADSIHAELASTRRNPALYSLSPQSLITIPHGTRLVLPSPNGATLTLAAGQTPTLAGCLRNARAVARAAQKMGKRIAVIPAGERWSDGSLRPALEDWLGAGAILDELEGTFSPEAQAARLAFRSAVSDLKNSMAQCSSGKELIFKNFGGDVELASELNVSANAPLLVDGVYQTLLRDNAN